MYFSDIIGQQEVKQRLLSIVKSNKLGHALLLKGQKGVGKLSLAIALSQYLSCKNPNPTDSCGKCNSCKKFEKLIHPDLHFSFPIFKKSAAQKSVCSSFLAEWRNFVLQNPYDELISWYKKIGIENKQGVIYVDESEDILRNMNLKPYEATYKSFIFWLPEKMNQNTANKLLKVIEEPYENTIILLVSQEPERLLPTILSRTQQINIPPIKSSEIEAYLQKNETLTEDKIRSITRLSKGSFTKTLKLLNAQTEALPNFEKFIQMMRIFYQKNIHELNTWSEDISKLGRERQKAFISYAMSMFRGGFMLKYYSPELIYLSSQEIDLSGKIAPFIHHKDLHKLYDELSTTITHISRNGNPQIVFFDFALKVSRLITATPA